MADASKPARVRAATSEKPQAIAELLVALRAAGFRVLGAEQLPWGEPCRGSVRLLRGIEVCLYDDSAKGPYRMQVTKLTYEEPLSQADRDFLGCAQIPREDRGFERESLCAFTTLSRLINELHRRIPTTVTRVGAARSEAAAPDLFISAVPPQAASDAASSPVLPEA